MSVSKSLKKLAAGFVSAAVLLSPLMGSTALAEDDVYTVSVTPESVTAEEGEEFTLTATFFKNGEEFDPSDEDMHICWWSVTENTEGTNPGEFTNSFIYEEAGVYEWDLKVELKDSDWAWIAGAYPVVTVTEPQEPVTEAGDGLSVSLGSDTVAAGDTVPISASYVIDGETWTELPDGYNLWFWADKWSDGHEDGSTDISVGTNSGTTLSDNITFNSEGTYYIAAELQNEGSRVDIAFITVEVSAAGTTITAEPVEGRLNFDGVPSLPEDFFMGVDISSVVSELNAGVVYYDYSGNRITTVSGFIAFLASQGVNCVRVRVWNNPYDESGNGFGGGNNDVNTAKTIADACEAAGITMLVDFHLSDFWCDPGKQNAPVAWAEMTVGQKASAVSEFIISSLNTIDPNRNTVVMVQVGNETNGAVCGVSGSADMCVIFDAGCDAVHSWNESTRAVIHFTNPERGTLANWAQTLSSASVSADVLATSYYPYWHGSLSNLTSQLNSARSCGFDVMVVETSYAYTLEDSDGHSNTVRPGNNDTGDNLLQPFTVQGQARAVRDVVNAVNNAGGIGMFYWEPAWITVGSTIGLTGSEYDSQVASNRALWEQYGCGWASSFAKVYDPIDAGTWYGGSAVDNEALFYADGTPTASWGVFAHIRTGEYCNEITAEAAASVTQTIEIGGAYEIPSTVTVTYSNGSTAQVEVSWNEAQLSAVDPDTEGTYTVNGTCEGLNVTYTLTVLPVNLIDADVAGFETDNDSAYSVEGDGISVHSTADVRSGSYAAHWWASGAVNGRITLTDAISLTEAGTYTFTGYAQGDADKGSFVTFMFLDAATGETLAESGTVQTIDWNNWISPSATLTVSEPVDVILAVGISFNANGWGTIDDLSLFLSEPALSGGEEPAVIPADGQPEQQTEQPASQTPSQPASAVASPAVSAAPAASSGSAAETFITNLYMTLLGRKPDPAGMEHWATGLTSGRFTLRDVLIGIATSEEYISRGRTDEEFVDDLYAAMLGRDPDETGRTQWLSWLTDKISRIDVIDGIYNSPEFRLRAEENGLKAE